MTEQAREDPYSSMAILSDTDFELSGEDIPRPVSLHFEPDAAFILVTFLPIEGEFTAGDIVKTPGYDEAVGGRYPDDRFRPIVAQLRFTFQALNSTLIQVNQRNGSTYSYQVNPDYTITDRRPITE